MPLALSDLKRGLQVLGATRFQSGSRRVGEQFKAALAEYLGVRVCGLASSGRAALYLLLKSLAQATGSPQRREVLLPAYTCPALVKVALDVKLRPRFVDISPDTLTFAQDRLEACLGEQTLAVICVHPFGIPQPLDNIMAMARAVGAVVIEDAAQAMGARLEARMAGATGDFALFSLGPGKPLSTGGGGIVCAARAGEADVRRVEKSWAALPAPTVVASGWGLVRLGLLTLVFHPRGWWLASRAGLHRLGEHEASWGYRCCGLTELQAAIGLALLERLDAINSRRREKAGQLAAGLQALDFAHIPRPAGAAEPIYLRLPVLIDGEERRERLFRRLWQAGIGVGRMYRKSLPGFFPNLASEACPGAEQVARRLLTLPTHHYLTEVDVERITEIFQVECAGQGARVH
jgi:dTDP-4-amino-4,6-dideoxygalactose transaminase